MAKRAGFKGRMVREFVVTCGALSCDYHEYVGGVADARQRGWHEYTRGVGWVCKDCVMPADRAAVSPARERPE